MTRRHLHVVLLVAVLSSFWSGCGGFNGVLAPTLSSITPTTVAAGGADFTLTAAGSNFAQGTTILWNGASLPTAVSSSTQLTAKVSAAAIANAGVVSVRVLKSDSTTSDAINLTITGGTVGGSFSLTAISPSAVAAGSADFALTATGTGFVSGAAITLNGTALATTFDSATQLHATVPAADVTAAGTITVAVTNPDKSSTNTLPLTVIAGGLGPAPTLTSINPNTIQAGATSPLTLTATGTNFVTGSTVMWNGVAMTTTFVSSTQLTATIPASEFNIPPAFFDPATSTATEQVFVLNPDSTASNVLPFTITLAPNIRPTLVTVFNPSKTQRSKVGDPGFTLTLCGNLFYNGATAYFGTTALQTSAVAPAGPDCLSQSPATNQPSQQVTAQVPASFLTAVAQIPVTVQNPQSQPSNAIPYYVGMNIYFDESSDVVWDSRFNLLYVSKPSTAQKSKDAIVAFSTRTGLNDAAAAWIYQLPSGSNPDRLALSSDGKYLYVGLDGTGQVQQLVISGASTSPTAGNTISLGSDPTYGKYYALDLAVAPAPTTTIAVARGVAPSQSHLTTLALGGIAIYDGTTQRPNTVGTSSNATGTALFDTLQWSADASTIYAANNENATGNLYTLTVSASGVALPTNGDSRGIFTIPNPFIHLDPVSGLLYGDDGLQVNPAVPSVTADALTNGIMTPDPAGGKAYFVSHPTADPNQLRYFIGEFDLTTLAPGASLDLYEVQGIPQHVVRWNNSSDGTRGVAFTTKKFNCLYSPCNVGDGRLYVINFPL